MNKSTWKLAWGVYRRHGFDSAQWQSGKDAAFICRDVFIERATNESILEKAKNRRNILAYAREMGRVQRKTVSFVYREALHLGWFNPIPIDKVNTLAEK